MTPRGRRRRPVYVPLDFRCPVCGSRPGLSCTWTDAFGTERTRHSHAERVQAARDETSSAASGSKAPRSGSSPRRLPPGSRS